LVGWRFTGGGIQSPLESQVFLPEELWFDRLPNPFHHWRGLSPLVCADIAMKTDHSAASYMRGLIENNGDLGMIVRTSDSLDETQKEQILAAIRNRRAGCGSPARPLLLWDSCEVIKPTVSSADLQFIENRKFSRSEICAALGVPEEIVSTTDHNKYDVMQGARLNFIENRVAPLCARLAAAEQRVIRQLDRSAVGWFDLDALPIMQQAWRTRLAAAKTGFDMGIPFNELNRTFDLGFQHLPHGDTCYVSKNLQPVGQLSSSAAESNHKPQSNSAEPYVDTERLEQMKDLCRRMKQNGM
jgi:HK97 family phage portal protein